MPLWATVLAVILLAEQVTWLQFVGVLLVVAGVALISLEGATADRAAGEGVPWLGLALPLASAFLFAAESILASVGFAEGTPVLVGLSIKTVAATAMFVPYLAVRGVLPTPSDFAPSDRRWYLVAGIFSTGFQLSYYAGLEVSSVGVVVPIMQTSPLLVTLAAALFMRELETVGPRTVAAAAIVVTGAITVTLTG
jgi:drug/metabolite transporter (DMT)-like permease